MACKCNGADRRVWILFYPAGEHSFTILELKHSCPNRVTARLHKMFFTPTLRLETVSPSKTCASDLFSFHVRFDYNGDVHMQVIEFFFGVFGDHAEAAVLKNENLWHCLDYLGLCCETCDADFWERKRWVYLVRQRDYSDGSPVVVIEDILGRRLALPKLTYTLLPWSTEDTAKAFKDAIEERCDVEDPDYKRNCQAVVILCKKVIANTERSDFISCR